jgi:hypothetical protein
MTGRTSRSRGWIVALALTVASAALAQESPPSAPPAPTPEARAQMAAVHEKMATCLRSERPIAECRAEMWQGCQQHMGPEGCPMMGRGMMGRGMMGGQGRGPGMAPGAPSPEPPRE